MNTNAPNFFYPVRVSWFNRVRKYKSHPSYVRMKQNYKWNAIWKYIHALVFCIKINGPHIISSFLLLLACCLGSSMVSLPHRWYPLVKRCRQPSQPPHPAPTAPVLCRNPRELEERNEAPRPQSKKEHKRKKKNPDTSSSRRSDANKEAFATDADAVFASCMLNAPNLSGHRKRTEQRSGG